MVGVPEREPERPDIAIEVVWTRGGMDKLAICRRLGVPEVWIWQEGEIRIHLLLDGDYRAAARSALLPAVDPALISACMAASGQSEAVRRLRRALRGRTA